jgi:hypothetical protein
MERYNILHPSVHLMYVRAVAIRGYCRSSLQIALRQEMFYER